MAAVKAFSMRVPSMNSAVHGKGSSPCFDSQYIYN